LANARDRGELVQHAVDMHRLHRRALQRGQKDAAQRVTERLAEAALERLGDNSRKPVRIAPRRYLQLVRSNKFLPIFLDRHCVTHGPADLPSTYWRWRSRSQSARSNSKTIAGKRGQRPNIRTAGAYADGR